MLRSYLLLVALLALTSSKAAAYPYPPLCEPAWCTAAKKKDESVIREAIQNGNSNSKICSCICEPPEDEWKRLLHVTACSEAVAFADLMITNPPDCWVDIYDVNGNTPLHEAAGCCNTPMAYVRYVLMRLLSEFGAF